MGLRSYLATAKKTTLVGDMSISATSFNVADGNSWPTTNFVITFERNGVKEEKVLVGVRSGNSCTAVQRGFDGTSAIEHTSGVDVEHTDSATDFAEANRHINDTAQAELDHPNFHTAARHAAVAHTAAMYAAGSVTNPALGDGAVDTRALIAAIPRGTLGYKQGPGNQTVGTSPTAVTGVSVDVTVGTGRRIRITVEMQIHTLGSSTNTGIGQIREGNNIRKDRAQPMPFANVGTNFTFYKVLSPTAGNHTYHLTLHGTNTSLVVTDPSILVEDIGAA